MTERKRQIKIVIRTPVLLFGLTVETGTMISLLKSTFKEKFNPFSFSDYASLLLLKIVIRNSTISFKSSPGLIILISPALLT